MSYQHALSTALAGTGAAADFSGDWKNELKSTMNLTQVDDVLTGVYESAVSGGGGTTKGDIQGYVDGTLISFIVHWRDFQAITAWVGRMTGEDDDASIETLWQMIKQVPEGEEWESINAGTDRFTRP